MKGHNFGLCKKCSKQHIPYIVKREVRICICGKSFKCKVNSKQEYCCTGHAKLYKVYVPTEVRFCGCRCGKTFVCKVNSKKRFINGHQNRGVRNSGFGKFGILNNFAKQEIIEKIKIKHKKEIICIKCKDKFITYQANPNNIPKYCKKCLDFGGKCFTCNCAIKLGRKFCSICQKKNISLHMKNNNPMKNKEVRSKVVDTLRKNGMFDNGGVFGKLWKNKREVMMSAIHSEKRKSKEYRDKCSKSRVQVMKEGGGYSYGKSGHFFSKKNNKLLHYRSSWELIYYQMLEVMSKIAKYEVEIISIPYKQLDGSIHRYLIDLKIQYIDGHIDLVEIKSDWKIKDINVQLKLEAGKKYAEENGMGFLILTKRDIDKYKNEVYKN